MTNRDNFGHGGDCLAWGDFGGLGAESDVAKALVNVLDRGGGVVDDSHYFIMDY